MMFVSGLQINDFSPLDWRAPPASSWSAAARCSSCSSPRGRACAPSSAPEQD